MKTSACVITSNHSTKIFYISRFKSSVASVKSCIMGLLHLRHLDAVIFYWSFINTEYFKLSDIKSSDTFTLTVNVQTRVNSPKFQLSSSSRFHRWFLIKQCLYFIVINYFNIPGCNRDIIFVLDDSGSVGSTNFHHALDFVRSIVKEIEVGPTKAQIGFLSYSTHPQVCL